MGKYSLLIFVCLAISAYAEDQTCRTGARTGCVKAEHCPQFVRKRDQLKPLARGSTLYNNLLGRLKKHICDKVKKKVCCKTIAEIGYGSVVDYASAKSSYPFMARIIMDGRKCGGALISDNLRVNATNYKMNFITFWKLMVDKLTMSIDEHNKRMGEHIVELTIRRDSLEPWLLSKSEIQSVIDMISTE